MTVKTFLFATLSLGICFVACTNPTIVNDVENSSDPMTSDKPVEAKSYISIFEIPALDISRAIDFYSQILDIEIEKVDLPEMQMGIFPYEGQMSTGVIVKVEGHNPSANGVTIYLNGGDNLQVILDKVEKSGGEILVAKTPHADENGYFALFLDSEGNKIGLDSPN